MTQWLLLITLFGLQACTTTSHRPSEEPPPAAKSHLDALGDIVPQPWSNVTVHRGGFLIGDADRAENWRYTDCSDTVLDVTWFWYLIPWLVSYDAKITCPEHQWTMTREWRMSKTPFKYDNSEGKKFVNAWYRLSQMPVYQGSRSEEFAAVVQRARASKKKFELPESLREYKIKAESDVKAKRYWDAAIAYEKALQQAPEWPQGHYNLALLLADWYLVDAIDEMEKYLMLVPDAGNRRAVLDKIYEWKGRLPESVRPALKPLAVE